MSEPLIINVSRDLGWRRRLASRASTLALWGGFAFLWLPVLLKLHEVVKQRLSFEPAAIEGARDISQFGGWRAYVAAA